MQKELPDVAIHSKSKVAGTIDRVGMSGIEIPVVILSQGEKYRSPAKVAAYVSLDKTETKGIHMSRLFSRLQKLSDQILNAELLEEVVKSFQQSHAEMSRASELRLTFDLMMKRQSLISNMTGWRHYPITINVVYDHELKKTTWTVGFEVVYSSTCPCSAALARQLIQDKFMSEFKTADSIMKSDIYDWLAKEESICATPHSQRSIAGVSMTFKSAPKEFVKRLEDLIEVVEATLGTPVQSFVKRVDEQEFARLNGENLMFCEDAARRIQQTLKADSTIESFAVEIEHQESLHPHNAVARVWS